mgnify:CR=1 FL=1
MFTVVFYAIAVTALVASIVADRGKTRRALVKSGRAFVRILPEFIVVIVAAGIILAFIEPEVISRMIGEESGFLGVLTASVVGSISLMPGFVAFPLASAILKQGAGIMQIGAFVSALMMVGVITFPVERTVFGTRVTIMRNLLAFVFTFIVAGAIAIVLGGSV